MKNPVESIKSALTSHSSTSTTTSDNTSMSSFDIPKKQIAAIRTSNTAYAKAPATETDVQLPGPTEILVNIKWTGLCGSDDALIHGFWRYAGTDMAPATKGIAGHEGAGVVVAVGDAVKDLWKVGDLAGVKWLWSTCGKCHFCWLGQETHCINQETSGVSKAGTFQQYCVADGRYTTKIPEGLDLAEVAPLMCGGVTVYKGLKSSDVKAGEWVVLSGGGGGLGHMGVQFAKAMGMRIIVVDGGEEKGKLVKQLGAEHYIDYHKTEGIAAEVKKITTYGAHGVVVTAYLKEAYEVAPTLLRPKGVMVAVGIPHSDDVFAKAQPVSMALDELQIRGSVVGTLKEVEEVLELNRRGLVKPMLHRGTLAEVDKYIELMESGKMPGRVSLKVSD